MMTEVLVKLAARDPWSFTVEDTLRRKLGWRGVRGVERLKSWQLDFGPADEAQALLLTGKILDETALFANPNRDLWVARGPSGPDMPAAFLGRPGRPGSVFAVRVADREDVAGRSMEAILTRRLHLAAVRAVHYSVVWILAFDATEADPGGLAERIATARSWRRGLLANPHSQKATVQSIEDFAGRGAALP
jgi:phosphoribosylformylglycinamidine (FGAM) synthase PurS component